MMLSVCLVISYLLVVVHAVDETYIIKCDYGCHCKDNFWVDDNNETTDGNTSIPFAHLILFGRYHMLEVDCRSRNLQGIVPTVIKNATRLLLSHNHFESLPADTFMGYTNIAELDLTYNGIKEIHVDAFRGMTSLHILSLGFNELTTLPGECFHGLNNLFALYLGYNKLTEMPPLKYIENLSNLDLNYNQIQEIDTISVSDTANILRFGLFGNKLKTISNSLVQFMDKYSTAVFTLSSNPWRCDCNMLTIKDKWPRHPKFIFDSIYCDTPSRLKGMNLWNLDNSELVCSDENDVITEEDPARTLYTSSNMLGAAFGCAFLSAIVTSFVWAVIWRRKRPKERMPPDARSFIHM